MIKKGKNTLILLLSIWGLSATGQNYAYQNIGVREGLSQSTVTAITQDQFGFLWIGTQDGLNCYDGHIFKSYHYQPFDTSSLPINHITALSVDKFNQIWVGTSAGLCLFMREKEQWLRFKHSQIKSSNIVYIHHDTINQLWVATANDLYCYKYEKKGELGELKKHYQNLADVDDEIRNKLENPRLAAGQDSQLLKATQTLSVTHLLKDQLFKEVFWLGTSYSGLIKVTIPSISFYSNELKEQEGIINNSVKSLAEDKLKRLWIIGPKSLRIVDSSNQTLFRTNYLKLDQKKIPIAALNVLYTDWNGNIWAGSKQMGGFKLNWKYKEIIGAPISLGFEQKQESIYAFAEDKQFIYLGAKNSIHLWDKKNRQFVKKILELGGEWKNQTDLVIRSIYFDSQKVWWIGTNKGLFIGHHFHNLKHYHHNPIDTNSLPDNHIIHIYKDQIGNIWLCTFGGLVKVMQKGETTSFKCYSTKNGLPNNFIYSLLEDKESNHFWLSTNRGLSRFDYLNEQFVNFNQEDGLANIEFNAKAFAKGKSGKFYFGGINGYTSFYPEQIQAQNYEAPAYFTRLEVNGGPTIQLLGNKQREYKLKYYQNSFSLYFTGIDFLNPSQLQFKITWNGTKDSILYTGNTRSIHFSKIPSGKYHLQLETINRFGIVSRHKAKLHLGVQTPFWKATWFWFLVSLVSIGFFGFLIWFRYRLKLSRMMEIEKIRKAAARDFHDEMGSKLSIITLYSELAKAELKNADDNTHNFLEKVIHTSGDLYQSMKDLIWALQPEKDNLQGLFLQIKDYGEELYRHSNMKFETEGIPEKLGTLEVPMKARRHILFLFKEAMNNAFRHSRANKVNLNIFKANNQIIFELADDGIGWRKDQEKQGNGLSNMQARARESNAILNISTNKKGSLIQLILHLKTDNLKRWKK